MASEGEEGVLDNALSHSGNRVNVRAIHQVQIKKEEGRFRHFTFSFSVSSGPEKPGQPDGKAEPHSLGLCLSAQIGFSFMSSAADSLNSNSVKVAGQRKFLAFQSSCFLSY